MPSIIRIATSAAGGVTASVNAIANQTSFAPVTLGVTPSAGTPTVYSWLVNDATTGLSSSTVAAPVFTPTQPGGYMVSCTVTIGGEVIVASSEFFLVGDGLLPIRDGATGTVVDTL